MFDTEAHHILCVCDLTCLTPHPLLLWPDSACFETSRQQLSRYAVSQHNSNGYWQCVNIVWIKGIEPAVVSCEGLLGGPISQSHKATRHGRGAQRGQNLKVAADVCVNGASEEE